MWLIGRKFSVIDAVACSPPHVDRPDRRHAPATRRSGYMAPLGAPVLPEV